MAWWHDICFLFDSEPTFASFAPPLFGPSGAIAPRRDPLEPPATRQRLPPPAAQFGDTVVVFGPPAPACLLPPRQPSAVAVGRPQAKPPHRLRSELGRASAGPYPFAPPLLPDAAVASQGPSPALGEQAARPSGEAPPQEDEPMGSQDGSQGARPPPPPPPLSADVVMLSQDSQGARPPSPPPPLSADVVMSSQDSNGAARPPTDSPVPLGPLASGAAPAPDGDTAMLSQGSTGGAQHPPGAPGAAWGSTPALSAPGLAASPRLGEVHSPPGAAERSFLSRFSGSAMPPSGAVVAPLGAAPLPPQFPAPSAASNSSSSAGQASAQVNGADGATGVRPPSGQPAPPSGAANPHSPPAPGVTSLLRGNAGPSGADSAVQAAASRALPCGPLPAPGATSLLRDSSAPPLPRSPAASAATNPPSSAQQAPAAAAGTLSCIARHPRHKSRAPAPSARDAVIHVPPAHPRRPLAPPTPPPPAGPGTAGVSASPVWPSCSTWVGPPLALGALSPAATTGGSPPSRASLSVVPLASISNPATPPEALPAVAPVPDLDSSSPGDRVSAQIRAQELKRLLTSAQLSDPGSGSCTDLWEAELESLIGYYKLPRCMAWRPR